MKKALSFLILLTTTIFGIENYSSVPHKPENIQVLLAKNIDEALLESKGAYTIINPHDGTKVTSSVRGKRFMIKATPYGIKWGEEFPGVHQVYIVPKEGTNLLINGIEYDGAVAVIKVKNKINIINEVDIESYLKSILTPQFQYPMENEVMAAIAIAARTTAYSHVKRNKDSFWHITADEVGYLGNAIIQPDSLVSQAIDKTKYFILIHSKKGDARPFFAAWTENSAGKTAAFHEIFRKDYWAPKMGVEAPHAALHREESKWSYSISKKDLSMLIGIDTIDEIDLFNDNFSKKTYALKVKSSNTAKDIDFVTFQNLVGKEKILSNDMLITIKNNQVIFTGYGKGYGVGLCLRSAGLMAQNGDNASKILSKFFPDTYILNISAVR